MNDEEQVEIRAGRRMLGLLSVEEEAAFAREAETDPRLAGSWRAARRFHRAALLLGHAARWSDSELEDQILAALPDAPAESAAHRSKRPHAFRPGWWRLAVAGLCAAVAAMLLLKILPSGPVHLSAVRVERAVMRGAGTEEPARDRALRNMSRELSRSIATHYEKGSADARPIRWRLEMTVTDVPGRGFDIEVTARRREAQAPVRSWRSSFDNDQRFEESREAWAAKLAGELAAMGVETP